MILLIGPLQWVVNMRDKFADTMTKIGSHLEHVQSTEERIEIVRLKDWVPNTDQQAAMGLAHFMNAKSEARLARGYDPTATLRAAEVELPRFPDPPTGLIEWSAENETRFGR